MRTGRPKMGQGRACTMEAKAFLVHRSYQGVCGRYGMEDECSDPWRSRMSGTLALYKDGWINKVGMVVLRLLILFRNTQILQ